MKTKLLLLQLPIILLCSGGFLVSELGTRGELESPFLRSKIWPITQRLSGAFTDVRFRLRGPQPPRSKIVIVDVDEESIETLGRWPWHRDAIGFLIKRAFDAGAKVVGFDMVFSERDQRVPDELKDYLKSRHVQVPVEKFETDFVLQNEIRNHAGNLVLGWTSDTTCQPAYEKPEDCPIDNPDWLATFPPNFSNLAVSKVIAPSGFNPRATAMEAFPKVLANEKMFDSVAKHGGFFNVTPDADGIIRKDIILASAEGRIFPSFALEMARVGLSDEIRVDLDSRNRVTSLQLEKSGIHVPVSPLGVVDINFRGPSPAFPDVSALELIGEQDQLEPRVGRRPAGISKKELLKDAFVLIGVSAIGAYDMRAYPFDINTPGVEGHATILDNILSNSFLVRASSNSSAVLLLLVMTLGVIGFGLGIGALESVPGLALFLGIFAVLGFIDVKLLFARNILVDSSFFYIEITSVFVLTLAAKYIVEERNKKFIRSAFTKYVSPDVVDAILKDPAKLSLGGEKRDLTILFSDIRGFTTFSEEMDAKSLAQFLNDYLDIMTGIVFKHGGTLDKYIGDAIMAFWGAPLEQEDHSLNACKAAVAMIQALGENRERFKKQYGVDVSIGIGINSGMVNVGNMGSSQNFEYTVIGDHVNLASRTEGLTKTYGVDIVTTRFTLDEITKHGLAMPHHRVLDQVKVKGKKNSVELVQLLDHELSKEGVEAFEEARQLYRRARWDEAIAKFQLANAALAGEKGAADGPCQVFIERCKNFKIAPPEKGWDGSWEMHSK